MDAPPDTVASLLVKQYDFLTVDLGMPEMDGTDGAELARELDSRIPIVVISGFLTPGVKERFREMGIQHFGAKPFRSKEFILVLGEALVGAGPPPNYDMQKRAPLAPSFACHLPTGSTYSSNPSIVPSCISISSRFRTRST